MQASQAAHRRPELVVVSDVHLGTRGARAEELLRYLRRIRPKTLVLNGDIIDFWQFSKRYWPATHMKVLRQILHLAAKGTRVVYLSGNHDDKLRRFEGLVMGNLEIHDQLELELSDGQRVWLFHGDVFDAVMQHSPWLAKLGAVGYDSLIAFNVLINSLRRFMGMEKVSLSKKVKDNIKTAVAFINDFERTAALAGIARGVDAVVCGHIHQPALRTIDLGDEGSIWYYNSGDWVENLSALEFDNGCWSLYKHEEQGRFEEEPTQDEIETEVAPFPQAILQEILMAQSRVASEI